VNSFRFGAFQLNPDGTLWCDGSLVPLSPMQRRLLLTFCRRPRQVIAKETLMLEVWGRKQVSEVSLARTVHSLRRRLSESPHGSELIRNVYGEGYLLTTGVEPLQDEPSADGEPAMAPRARSLLKV
jgi:DNA-binding winged helix-turn-helix (wHTH) protein